MPKTRWPIRSASVCRIFPGARLSARHRGERLDQAVHALGRLEQDGAAVGTRVLLVERGDEGLVEQIREQNSLWYRVRCHAGASVVAKRLYTLRLYHTEALVSLPKQHLHA